MQPTPTGYEAAWTARTDPTLAVARGGASALSSTRTVTIRRELVGDLPDEVSFVGGSAAASATLTVDAPSAGTSPLVPAQAAAVLAQAVTVGAGFGGGTVPMFTGTTREFSIDDAGMSQQVLASDGADLLSAPVTLSPWGSLGWGPPEVPATRRFPTNSSALIVAALHACGVRVTPGATSGTVASVPLVGGCLADPGMGSTGLVVGSIGSTSAGVADGATWLADGPFGPVPSLGAQAVWVSPGVVAPWTTSRAIAFEAWVKGAVQSADRIPVSAYLGKNRAVGLRIGGSAGSGANVLDIMVRTEAGSWVLALSTGDTLPTSGWTRLALWFDRSGNVQIWYGETAATASGLWATTSTPAESGGAHFRVLVDGTVQALRGWAGTDAATFTPTATTFTSKADVEAGALDMDVVPSVSGRTAWDLIKSVAAAELGFAGFDEAGRFAFRQRATINATTTPVETIDTVTADNVRGKVTTAGIRTRVTASLPRPWFTRYRTAAYVPGTSAHLPGSVLTIATGDHEQLITVSTPIFLESPYVPLYLGASAIGTEQGSGMVCCTDAAGSTLYTEETKVFGILRQVGPTSLILRTFSRAGVALYAVWPAAWSDSIYGPKAGGPGLWFFGGELAGDDLTTSAVIDVQNATAAATWGQRTYELKVSDWPGSPASVTALATALLADLDGPRIVLDPVTVPADPRRQLGDVVTLHDTQGLWPDIPARIVSLSSTLSLGVEGRMTQTLGLRALAS